MLNAVCMYVCSMCSETFMDDVGVLEKYLDSLRPSIPYNEKFQEGWFSPTVVLSTFTPPSAVDWSIPAAVCLEASPSTSLEEKWDMLYILPTQHTL